MARDMATDLRHVEYELDGAACDGVLVSAGAGGEGDGDGKRPTVLVFHGVEGRSEAQVEFARAVSEWGYNGFAVDLFGTDASAAGLERCQELMTGFLQDRALLRPRLLQAFEVAKSLPETDGDGVAAIGFCFGGLCVLDLARAGAAGLLGAASFHGVLTPPGLTEHAIAAKVLVLHGWDDPFAPPDDVTALGRELSTRGADWQVHAYGSTMHAFMAPWADDPESGVRYNSRSARRAWASLAGFLAEVFADVPGADLPEADLPGGGGAAFASGQNGA